jgi:hypothetical protein
VHVSTRLNLNKVKTKNKQSSWEYREGLEMEEDKEREETEPKTNVISALNLSTQKALTPRGRRKGQGEAPGGGQTKP